MARLLVCASSSRRLMVELIDSHAETGTTMKRASHLSHLSSHPRSPTRASCTIHPLLRLPRSPSHHLPMLQGPTSALRRQAPDLSHWTLPPAPLASASRPGSGKQGYRAVNIRLPHHGTRVTSYAAKLLNTFPRPHLCELETAQQHSVH